MQHGGASVQERNIFWITSGPSIQDGVMLPDDLSITDIPLTVLDFLGIEAPPTWNLDGVSILPTVTN